MSRMYREDTKMRKQIIKKMKIFGKERSFSFIRPTTKNILKLQNRLIKKMIGVLPSIIPEEAKGVDSLTMEDLEGMLEKMSMKQIFSVIMEVVKGMDDDEFLWIASTVLDDANIDGCDVNELEDSEYFAENPLDIYVCVVAGISVLFPSVFKKGMDLKKPDSIPGEK